MKSTALNMKIDPTQFGYDEPSIQKQLAAAKKAQDEKLREIEAFKRKQDKKSIKSAYFEHAEDLYSKGMMYKSMEAFRMSSCYSGSLEDIISVGIRLTTTAIHNKDYAYGLKFIKDAVAKDQDNPTSVQQTQLLTSLIALSYLGMGKYEKVCSWLWEHPIADHDVINHLASSRDMAFYATISGIQYYTRKEFKENVYAMGQFKLLVEQFPDIELLGKSYINFDFETYFKLLNSFYHEFKADPHIGASVFGLIENCKKGVMITYIVPYKGKVDLAEMATSFGMTTEEIEFSISNLIVEGDVKGRIDSYNKVLHKQDDNYGMKSFEKALEAGGSFLKNVEILLNKYHLDPRKNEKEHHMEM